VPSKPWWSDGALGSGESRRRSVPTMSASAAARLGPYLAGIAFALLAGAAASAAEPKSLAVMDFELIDEMRQYESEQGRRDTDRRLAFITAELVRQFRSRGMYRVVDNAPAAPLIEKLRASYDLRACNGCELDIGKALGVDRVALCWVQKVSNLILNIDIEVHAVPTGETVYAKSVDIRGNTDEAWLRGVRRLVDNIEDRGHHTR